MVKPIATQCYEKTQLYLLYLRQINLYHLIQSTLNPNLIHPKPKLNSLDPKPKLMDLTIMLAKSFIFLERDSGMMPSSSAQVTGADYGVQYFQRSLLREYSNVGFTYFDTS